MNIQYSNSKPIRDQNRAGIEIDMHLIWFQCRKVTLQVPESSLPKPSEIDIEIDLIRHLMNQHSELTPSEFAACIRASAMSRAEEVARTKEFPTMLHAHILPELRKAVTKKRENDTTPRLPEAPKPIKFHGDPQTALDREWPEIWAAAKSIRNMFGQHRPLSIWRMVGTKEERQAGEAVWAEIVWCCIHIDRAAIDLKAAAIYRERYTAVYPKLAEQLPENLHLEEVRSSLVTKTLRQINARHTEYCIADMPEWDDCWNAAIFFAYGEMMEIK